MGQQRQQAIVKTDSSSRVIQVQQMIAEPMFKHWCQHVFWAFVVDQEDLENKIMRLLDINHFEELKTNKYVLNTFEFYLGRPYLIWYEKRAAGAHSMYQVPAPYMDDDYKNMMDLSHPDIKADLKHVS